MPHSAGRLQSNRASEHTQSAFLPLGNPDPQISLCPCSPHPSTSPVPPEPPSWRCGRPDAHASPSPPAVSAARLCPEASRPEGRGWLLRGGVWKVCSPSSARALRPGWGRGASPNSNRRTPGGCIWQDSGFFGGWQREQLPTPSLPPPSAPPQKAPPRLAPLGPSPDSKLPTDLLTDGADREQLRPESWLRTRLNPHPHPSPPQFLGKAGVIWGGSSFSQALAMQQQSLRQRGGRWGHLPKPRSP